MIEFQISGRRIRPEELGDAVQAAFLGNLRGELRAKIGGIRDPETGEFPRVLVEGRDFDSLSVRVEGSERVVQLVTEKLGGVGEGVAKVDERNESGERPVVFLCHGSEDKSVVRRLATDLSAHGVEVFFDEWEITAGDSLRRRIEEGFGRCTHFVAVLSATSIKKPWVNAEMDAGFVQKLERQAKFIPLRLGLEVEELSPLLSALRSPSIDDYANALPRLVSDLHGIARRPPIGPAPPAKLAATNQMGLSPAAEVIAKVLVERSEHGETGDPSIEAGELRRATGLGDDDLIDGVDELEGLGLARKRHAIPCDPELRFYELSVCGELFVRCDPEWRGWNPRTDAILLSTKLREAPSGSLGVHELAESLEWAPRRMNPALHYLINRELVDRSRETGAHPWVVHRVSATVATRRFLQSEGG